RRLQQAARRRGRARRAADRARHLQRDLRGDGQAHPAPTHPRPVEGLSGPAGEARIGGSPPVRVYFGRTATHSISRRRSSRTRREISTSVLAGRLAPKYSWRTVLTFSRSPTFLRKTVTLQTSAKVAPAAARHFLRFSCTWRAWATTSLPPTVRPCSSLATQPDTNTRRSARTTWVKWLMGSAIPGTRISSRCAAIGSSLALR